MSLKDENKAEAARTLGHFTDTTPRGRDVERLADWYTACDIVGYVVEMASTANERWGADVVGAMTRLGAAARECSVALRDELFYPEKEEEEEGEKS